MLAFDGGCDVPTGFFVGVGFFGVGFFGVGFLGGGFVVTGVVEQVGGTIVSFCSVTAPFLASTRPCTVTPVFSDADVSAKMVPEKSEYEPSVAELPTCQ